MRKIINLKTRNTLLAGLRTNSFMVSRSNLKNQRESIGELIRNDLPVETMYSHRKNARAFIERQVKIMSPSKGLIDLTLNDKQLRILHQLEQKTGIIFDGILERQVGTSTVLCAYMLWYAIVNPGRTVFSMSQTTHQTYYVREMMRCMIEYLPDAFKPKLIRNNKQEIEFENGSFIKFVGSNTCACRGHSISLAVLHDYEYFKDSIKKEIEHVLLPVTSIYGKPIYL